MVCDPNQVFSCLLLFSPPLVGKGDRTGIRVHLGLIKHEGGTKMLDVGTLMLIPVTIMLVPEHCILDPVATMFDVETLMLVVMPDVETLKLV